MKQVLLMAVLAAGMLLTGRSKDSENNDMETKGNLLLLRRGHGMRTCLFFWGAPDSPDFQDFPDYTLVCSSQMFVPTLTTHHSQPWPSVLGTDISSTQPFRNTISFTGV